MRFLRKGPLWVIPAALLATVLLVGVSSGRGRLIGDRQHATSTDAPGPTSGSETVATSTRTATSAATSTTNATEHATDSLAGRVVVVDAGHNGGNAAHGDEIRRLVDAGGFQKACNTTGTAEGDLSESAFAWSTALVLKSALEAEGAVVALTRTSDDGVGPCVDVRGGMAALVGADALISIHADGSSKGNHGFHVIFPASRVGYTDRTAAASAQLAVLLRDRLVGQGWITSNYIGRSGLDERGDLGTLNRSAAPSVMVECGNMHDTEDLARMRSGDGRSSFARATVDALRTFLTGR